MSILTEYESKALKEIHAWKHPELGWFGKMMNVINWPLDKAGDTAFKTPGVGWVIEKSVNGIIGIGNDVAQWSVRHDAIYCEFRRRGLERVRGLEDIRKLSLEEIDPVIGWLAAKYKGAAFVEGGAAGSLGLPGIPPDVVALITLNLRAIGEYATYCGFRVDSQQERLFAMNVLGLASSPTDAAKTMALAQLVRIGRDVAKERTWKELQEHAFVQIIQGIAKALGVRLTKAKLAQILPAVGAGVGAGFNAYYTSRVCDAAYFLYRERFLAEKYGPEVIEATVAPAETLEPEYPDEKEADRVIERDKEHGDGSPEVDDQNAK